MSSNIKENINNDDLKNICRMCMINCDVKFYQDHVISNIFHKLTNLHFETNDNFPQQICRKCFEKVNEIHEFSFQLKRTHVALMKRLNKTKNERLIEEQKIYDEIEDDYQNDDVNPVEPVEDNKSAINCVIEEVKIKEETNVIENTFTSNIEDENKINLEEQNKQNKIDNLSQHEANINGEFVEYSVLKQETFHKGKRPFKCEQCLKTYKFSHTLEYHMREHSGGCLYKCDYCDKSFLELNNLKDHWRTHSGESPYVCSLCHKKYKSIGLLMQHKSIHTGEKPYKCSKCDASYARIVNLTKHLFVHHKQ